MGSVLGSKYKMGLELEKVISSSSTVNPNVDPVEMTIFSHFFYIIAQKLPPLTPPKKNESVKFWSEFRGYHSFHKT